MPPAVARNVVHRTLASYSRVIYAEWLTNEYVDEDTPLDYKDLDRAIKELAAHYSEADLDLEYKDLIVEFKRQLNKEVAMITNDFKIISLNQRN